MSVKTLHIVLVDDDELILELVKRQLQNSNIQLTAFCDELLALDYLRQNKPDILLLDQRMPRLDGIDLLIELGEEAQPDQVYLCSGAPLPPNLQIAASQCGAQILNKNTLVAKNGLINLFGSRESKS